MFSGRAPSRCCSVSRLNARFNGSWTWLIGDSKVRLRLTGCRDILSAGLIENRFRSLHPIGVVAVDRQKDSALSNASFVALRFVFRSSQSCQSSGNPADHATDADSTQETHDGASGHEHPE